MGGVVGRAGVAGRGGSGGGRFVGFLRRGATTGACGGGGVGGAVLWYPSGVLQHAGIVAGVGDAVGHAGRYLHSSKLWPWLLATRNVSAVTGACAVHRGILEHDCRCWSEIGEGATVECEIGN